WSWDGGDWSRNDPRHEGGNPWHYMITGQTPVDFPYHKMSKHLNVKYGEKATGTTASKFGGASGSGVDFYIGNQYIKEGKVRNYKTKEIIKFPTRFVCIDCGDIQHEIDAHFRTED
ncbi:hypothetical protein LCGC14_2866790, partial [marine sediment metagenome]